jgi:hypothetical protein
VSYEVLQALLVKVAIAYKNKSNEQKRLQDLQRENSDDNSSSIKKKSNSAAASGNKVNNGVSSSGTLLDNKKLTDALCGAIAGGLGSLATTPMDVVKTRMMTSAQYSSIWDATVRILKVCQIKSVCLSTCLFFVIFAASAPLLPFVSCIC